jgi:hypothetical protein
MKRLHRLGFALWLALALFAGQQLAVLHDLGHASEHLGHQQDQKLPKPCNTHFACSQLASAVGASAILVPVVASEAVLAPAFYDQGTPTPALLAYRSRAPPVSSV